MTVHRWIADGVRDLGEPRLRCVRCGMLSHWAGARDECPWMDAATVARLARLDAAQGRVVEHLRRPPPPTIDGRWAGPYWNEAARVCAHCSASFQRPKAMTKVRYCGPDCVRAVKRARVAAKMRETYHRRKLEEQP